MEAVYWARPVAYNQHVNEHERPSTEGKWLCPPNLLSLSAIEGKCLMKWTDFKSSQFPDDRSRHGPWNGLFTTEPPDMAASPRTIYWI